MRKTRAYDLRDNKDGNVPENIAIENVDAYIVISQEIELSKNNIRTNLDRRVCSAAFVRLKIDIEGKYI